MEVVFHHIGNPKKRITAQNAATTLDRVYTALGFSGGGRVEAEVLEVISGCEDPWSSCISLMIDRTCFRKQTIPRPLEITNGGAAVNQRSEEVEGQVVVDCRCRGCKAES